MYKNILCAGDWETQHQRGGKRATFHRSSLHSEIYTGLLGEAWKSFFKNSNNIETVIHGLCITCLELKIRFV